MLKFKRFGIILIFGLICTQVFAMEQTTSLNEFTSQNLQKNFNWNNYIKKMDQKLFSHWFPSKNNNKVEVIFNITKNGTYKNLRISKPSSNKKDNQAALEAVMYSSPFKPFPNQAKELMVKYTFSNQNTSNNNIHFIVLR